MKFKIKLPRTKINLREQGSKIGNQVKRATGAAKNRLHLESASRVDRLFAAISYLFFGGLVIRLIKKQKSNFLEYHTRQSVILFVLLAFLLLIPQYGVTVFGPIILLVMIVNIIVGAFGGTIRMLSR